MLSFFQGLAEVILNLRDWILPFSVLNEYERGVLLRLGRYSKDVGPGFIWHWPLGIDEVLSANVAFETQTLTSQGFTTKDGVPVAVEASVGFRITDIRKFLIEVEDTETVLVDATGGAIRQLAAERSWDEVCAPRFEEDAYKLARRRAFKYGVTVDSLFLRTLCRLGLREGTFFTLGPGV